MKKISGNKKKNSNPRVKAPRGFHFKIITQNGDYTRVSLRQSDNPLVEIGRVNLVKNKRRGRYYWETHSSLNEQFHGKGLGAIMYAKAIQWCLDRGERCRSSGSSSDMAKRVWEGKKIRRYFSIRKRVNSWGRATWFAYA